MKKVLIMDTSILCVWLKVKGKETCGSGVHCIGYEEVNQKIMSEMQESTEFVLPLATIIETGNHIAHMPGDRYEVAQEFADIIERTTDNISPWAAFTAQNSLWEPENLKALIHTWLSTVNADQSLGDASIVDVANYYSRLGCDVEIYTGDEGLKSYEPQSRMIPRRRR